MLCANVFGVPPHDSCHETIRDQRGLCNRSGAGHEPPSRRGGRRCLGEAFIPFGQDAGYVDALPGPDCPCRVVETGRTIGGGRDAANNIPRTKYKLFVSCLKVFFDALESIETNFDLAYSMFVYLLEKLSIPELQSEIDSNVTAEGRLSIDEVLGFHRAETE